MENVAKALLAEARPSGNGGYWVAIGPATYALLCEMAGVAGDPYHTVLGDTRMKEQNEDG